MTEVKLTKAAWKAAWKAALSVPIVKEWEREAEPSDLSLLGDEMRYLECGRRLDKG